MIAGSFAPVRIETGRFTLEGVSRAGNETYFRVRELGVALDIGRCPDPLVGLQHILISHAHLDHALGVVFYAAQRTLLSLPPGKVYVPAEAVDDFRRLISIHEQLEGCRYDLDLIGVAPGEEIRLRRDLVARAHEATHRIPALAWEIVELRHKLLPELAGRPEREIVALRTAGNVIESRVEIPLLYCTGDTDRELLDRGGRIFLADVLIIECSFILPEDRQRAVDYRHIHLDDLLEVASRLENRLIVLTHFSLRYSAEEIHRQISMRCPAGLRERIRLALPEPWVRLEGVG